MRQTLFYIPREVAGWPLFGFGLLLAIWAVVSVLIIVYLVRRQGFNADTRSYLPLLAVIGAVIAFLLPVLSEPQGIPIRGYGVMLLVGVVSGVALGYQRAMRRGIDPDLYFSLAFWIFAAGIIGARAFYVIEYWREFLKPTPEEPALKETLLGIINVTQGGLVVYGSLIGAGVAAIIFVRKHRLPALKVADLVAPPMVLGLAIGRLGCFLNGCCFGGMCELPWAVTFPWGSPPYKHQAERGLIVPHGIRFAEADDAPPIVAEVKPGSQAAKSGLRPGDRVLVVNDERVGTISEAQFALLRQYGEGTEVSVLVAGSNIPKRWRVEGPPPRSLPVHPAQLYASLDAFLLLLLLLAYEPFSRRDGELLALTLTLHPIARFLLEIIRVDEAFVFGTKMSISQNISLLILAGAAVLWCYILRQPRAPDPRSHAAAVAQAA